MCLAIPGKVLFVREGQAMVEVEGRRLTVALGGLAARRGDIVLVQGQRAVARLGAGLAGEFPRASAAAGGGRGFAVRQGVVQG